MTEREWSPPFELWKHDSGVDGWDAKRWLVANFTTKTKAEAYLTARGYTHREGPTRYAHHEEARRHTMGQITYEIREVKVEVPTDPE